AFGVRRSAWAGPSQPSRRSGILNAALGVPSEIMQHDDSATDYASRTTAVFLGVAIADALSFPLIDYSRRFLHVVPRSLTSEYTPHASGEHPIGQFSAETQSLPAVARAISDARGGDARTIAEFLVPLWRDLLVIAPDPSTSEAMQGLVRGVVSDEQSG